MAEETQQIFSFFPIESDLESESESESELQQRQKCKQTVAELARGYFDPCT